MAASQISLNQIDYSSEKTSTKMWVPTVTGATLDALSVLANLWRTAIEAVSLCNEVSLTMSLDLNTASGAAPTNVLAQREFIIRVFYVDDTNGRTGSFTIPGPDLSLLTVVGDEVDLTDGGEMAAIVTATEDLCSRDENPITVTRAIVTGRNG